MAVTIVHTDQGHYEIHVENDGAMILPMTRAEFAILRSLIGSPPINNSQRIADLSYKLGLAKLQAKQDAATIAELSARIAELKTTIDENDTHTNAYHSVAKQRIAELSAPRPAPPATDPATAAAFERLRGDSITTPDQVSLRKQWFKTLGLMDVYLAVSTGHEVMIYDAIRRAERTRPPPTRYDGTAATRPTGWHTYWSALREEWIEQDREAICSGEWWYPLPTDAPPSEVSS